MRWPCAAEVTVEGFERLSRRLNDLSRERHASPFDQIVWPEQLDDSHYWHSPSLLSVHGTAVGESLTEETRRRLSKWECIQFFSINVHGERDVVEQLVRRFPFGEAPGIREYAHRFLEEEGQHIWFFSEFCVRYAGRVLANKKTMIAAKSDDLAVESLLDFGRILVFEEVGASINRAVARDVAVHPFIREIHRRHDLDESRHIAFGRELFRHHLLGCGALSSPATLERVRAALLTFCRIMVDSLVSPTAYREAGVADALALRQLVRHSPPARERNRSALRRFFELLESTGIATPEQIDAFDAE